MRYLSHALREEKHMLDCDAQPHEHLGLIGALENQQIHFSCFSGRKGPGFIRWYHGIEMLVERNCFRFLARYHSHRLHLPLD